MKNLKKLFLNENLIDSFDNETFKDLEQLETLSFGKMIDDVINFDLTWNDLSEQQD